MNYLEFLESKKRPFIESGFEIKENELNKNLFDFQKFIVKTALKKGRFAIFADCGLIISLIWSWNVKKIVFGTFNDRIVYAFGAAFGSLLGLIISKLIL